MARPHACCSPCQNSPFSDKDELADAAPTEGNSTPTPIPAVSRAPTSAPAITPCLNNKLFKQFMKAYLEAQVTRQIKVD